MSSGASGSDEKISGSKIEPLASDTKSGVEKDTSSRGAVGTDRTIDQARIDPIGGKGQYQHPAPHSDDQGVVGRDEVVEAARIDPLSGSGGGGQGTTETGLDDENVDAARVEPLGEVREEMDVK